MRIGRPSLNFSWYHRLAMDTSSGTFSPIPRQMSSSLAALYEFGVTTAIGLGARARSRRAQSSTELQSRAARPLRIQDSHLSFQTSANILFCASLKYSDSMAKNAAWRNPSALKCSATSSLAPRMSNRQRLQIRVDRESPMSTTGIPSRRSRRM